MNRRVAAVDLGTNSMRLLVVEGSGDGSIELGRWERVTGLGTGVDATGRLDDEAVERTLLVLAEFGGRMRELGVRAARVVATSASRDSSNREAFFDRAEVALGYRPQLIGGDEEASLSYAGATLDRTGSFLVIDVGGGSTEFVTRHRGVSVDIGSVRLTERLLSERPASHDQLAAASGMVAGLLSTVDMEDETPELIGVAGTFTSLAAIHLGLARYDRDRVHGTELGSGDVEALVEGLARLTVEETARIPSLDPARAPVILAGAVIVGASLSHLHADRVTVSVYDLLDGMAAALLAGTL